MVSPFLLATGLVVNDVADLVTPTPDLVGEIRDRLEAPRTTAPTLRPGTARWRRRPWRGSASPWSSPGCSACWRCGWLCAGCSCGRGRGRSWWRRGPGRPDPDDVEERQLVNLVEEMALAAGVPPPRVRLVDADDANAAVVGRSVDDATLVVPRGLLTELGATPPAPSSPTCWRSSSTATCGRRW